MPVYTRTELIANIWDTTVDANITSIVDSTRACNKAVRRFLGDVDSRSMKRRSAVSPNLFDRVFDYAKPSDMKDLGLIDIIPQLNRPRTQEWRLTTPEEFDRLKLSEQYLVAVWDADLVGKLRIAIDSDADQLVIGELNTLTGDGGTWAAFDSDTANVVADGDNYIRGSGSIRFDINAAGGTTAGIKNTGLDFDYDDYVTFNRSVFLFVYITSTTNITNYKLRLGSSESAYDTMTATTQSDGTAFRNGWNLLRFDFSGKSTTGSPTRTAGTYAAMYMTKAAGKVSETSYRFDYLVAQEGRFYELLYYTKYGWQNSSGTYLENSTAAGDYINCDTDDFDIIVQAGKIEKAKLERDSALVAAETKEYQNMVANYQLKNPSEAMILTTLYQ